MAVGSSAAVGMRPTFGRGRLPQAPLTPPPPPHHRTPAMIAHRDRHIALASRRDESFRAEPQMGIPVPCTWVAAVLRGPNRRRAAGGDATLDWRRASPC